MVDWESNAEGKEGKGEPRFWSKGHEERRSPGVEHISGIGMCALEALKGDCLCIDLLLSQMRHERWLQMRKSLGMGILY